MSVVFSRASGVFCVSRSFCSCLLGWGAGCGGFWGSGFGAPGRLASFLLGGGSGVRLRAPGCSPGCLVLAVVGSGGRGRVCACCPVPVVGVFGCFFRPVLLVSSGSAVLGPLLGCGFRGVGGLWGVSGWVRGCFFSGFCCTGPGLFPVSFVGAGLGLGWVLFGEFDPGSGRTLAACLTHASRTGPLSFLGVG